MSLNSFCSIVSTLYPPRRGCLKVDNGMWSSILEQIYLKQDMSSISSSIKSENEVCPISCVADVPICSNCTDKSYENQQVVKSATGDYRVYTKCSKKEFEIMSQIIKDASFGQINNKPSGFSLLDVGAATGHLFKKLVSSEVAVIPSHYVAFEPDPDAWTDLSHVLHSDSCPVPSFEIKKEFFSTSTSVEEAGGPFDIVLLSHVLYGFTAEDTVEIFKHSLHFVAPGGILLVFHHWKPNNNGKLDVLMNYLHDQNMMFYRKVHSVELDTSKLTSDETLRVEKYTGCTSGGYPYINRKIGVLAIEPSNCHVSLGKELHHLTQELKVSYCARSIVPADVCTPNSVVGIQACIQAAAEKRYGFDSISVIGGGHSANCLAKNALAINMHNWKRVGVRPTEMVVCVGGGATCGEVVHEAEKSGLLVPLGDRPGVGAGLILQGGINHFMRKFGLAIDNILRVVYVSPTGELLIAEKEQELMQFRGAGPHSAHINSEKS